MSLSLIVKMDLSVLPIEIRTLISSHLIHLSSRRCTSEFKKELLQKWFDMSLERILKNWSSFCISVYHSLIEFLYAIDDLPDLDETTRTEFHKTIIRNSCSVFARVTSRWTFVISEYNLFNYVQLCDAFSKKYRNCYLRGKLTDRRQLIGYLILFDYEQIETVLFHPQVYWTFPFTHFEPAKKLVLSTWEQEINDLSGVEVSFGNRQLCEQVLQKESSLSPLKFPTKYSDIVLGKAEITETEYI